MGAICSATGASTAFTSTRQTTRRPPAACRHGLCPKSGMSQHTAAPAVASPFPADEAGPALPRRTVWALAVGCGLAVANLYYAQPLLADLARSFDVPADRMGLAATLSQVGYGLGLL